MATIADLKWETLTAAVNEMKSPNQFLKKFLFPNHQTVPTEDIELSVFVKGREMAPFVRKNGEALLVKGHDEKYQIVTAPNIRIKRPFTPSELLFGRRPGTTIYPDKNQQMTAIQQHIARDLQVMADMVTNSEEYLCAQSLRGVISYIVADDEAYQITFPVPAENQVTLTTFWNNADPTLPQIEADILAGKLLASNAVGLGITDCILGSEATAAFNTVIKKQNQGNFGVIWNPGTAALAEQYTDDGAIFLGTIGGIRFWSYPRQITLPDGTLYDLIRPKYAEFISNTPAAERVLYYGAIPDMEAFQGGLFQAERFSKSWNLQDPSVMIALLHSRPLPVHRRPGSVVSFKVVSG